MLNCIICGKDLIGRQTKICSRKCQGQLNTKNKTGEFINCLQCNNSFYIFPYEKGMKKYCSNTCKNKAKFGKYREKNGSYNNCTICNREIYVTNSTKNKKFCSRTCHDIYQRQGHNLSGNFIKCVNCREYKYVCPSVLKNNNNKFCSIKCNKAYIHKNNIKVKCPICTKYFEVTPSKIHNNRGKYCSYHCSLIAKKQNKKAVLCSICNTEFKISNSSSKKTCSKKCASELRSANSKGNTYGFSKNSIPWNFGLTKDTSPKIKEIANKISINKIDGYLTGRLSPNVSDKVRGNFGFREDLGHFVRSQFEANYCRYLKYNNVDYSYEKHRFLIDGHVYIPDLYINNSEELIELKGYFRRNDEIKIKRFKELYPTIKFKLIMQKSDEWKSIVRTYRKLITTWGATTNV